MGSWFQPDSAAAGLGYQQGPSLGLYKRPVEDFLHTNAPERINTYRIGAERAIDDIVKSSMLSQSESIMGRFGMMQQQNADAAAQQGLNPAAYFASVNPQMEQQNRQQSAAVAGGAQAQGSMMGMDLGAQILNSMNQLEAYYDSLKLQNYMAAKGRETARKGARSGSLTSLAGGAMGMVGMLGMGGMGGAGAAGAGAAAGMMPMAFAASDERLKRNVETLDSSGPVRLVRWTWNETAERVFGLRGRGVGVIAQELRRVAPERVVEHPSGYLMVRLG